MVTLSRLTLKTKFYLMVGAAAAGLVTIGVTTYNAERNARVDAPGMMALLDSKDLLADFLSPAASLLEAYTPTGKPSGTARTGRGSQATGSRTGGSERLALP
jgi:hypothetical protein